MADHDQETDLVENPRRSRLSTPKEAPKGVSPPSEDDNQVKITITTIEYHNSEDEGRHRLRHFDGSGLNKVTLSKGSEVLEEKGWSHITSKHGSNLIDGRQHKIRMLLEE
jgi:hypothetical protein